MIAPFPFLWIQGLTNHFTQQRGLGFLSFLGFTYDSYISVIIFLIICYVMLIPADYYTSILIGLFKTKSNISRFQQRAIDFILYTSFSSLIDIIINFFI